MRDYSGLGGTWRFVSSGWGWSTEAAVALRRLSQNNILNLPLDPPWANLGGPGRAQRLP